jgi:hypothetical protein
MPVISVLKRLRQKECKFQAYLGYIVKLCFEKQKGEFWAGGMA